MRKAALLLVFSITFLSNTFSQTTVNCLEVESILVDACAPNGMEGQNEMVRILVGPNPLTVNNIIPTWPNNPFGGWINNAATLQKTLELNNGIQSCGLLLPPIGGIIPANKKAIIVTSWDMNTTSNSFAGLTDTMYIIFQNSLTGNSGHFANAGTGFRTLTINYLACTETVTYDRSLLTGGDGAYVDFTQAGLTSYGNNGCAAPVAQFAVEAGTNPAPACPSGTVNLSGTITGSATYQQWTGGTGSFSNSNNASTTYTLGAGQTSPFWLFFQAKGACADTLRDSVLITIQQQNPLQIGPNGPLSICAGNNLTLTASGGGATYQWTGGPNTAQYVINQPGTYTVQSSDACYNYQQSVTVNSGTPPSININQNDTSVCTGFTPFQVTALGNGTVAWTNGIIGNNLLISSAGTYIAGISNGCGVDSDTLIITALASPTAQITNAEPVSICAGNQVTLNATGNGLLTWNNSSTGNSIIVSTPGQYSVSTTNSCGTATDNITVTAATPAQVQITNPSPTGICAGQTVTLNATGNGNILWSNNGAGNTTDITAAGSYIATVTNNCGSSADTITIVQSQEPNAQITTVGPIIVCPGTNVTLNGIGNNLVWNTGAATNSITVNQPGTYFLVSQTSCGSDTAFIELENYTVNADFTATPTEGYAPLVVETTNQSTDATAYQWNFGDGNTSADDAPTNTYQQSGEYQLQLIAINNQGCSDTSIVQIKVVEELTVILPNIFTPNGDQVNDEYIITAKGVVSLKADIYNRWGEKMFSWSDPLVAWNGKSMFGTYATPGVYFCVVEVIDALGKAHTFKTTVTLNQ